MKTIKLLDLCGTEVLSRANIRRLNDVISHDTSAIDLNGITFISRSVADELCDMIYKYHFLIINCASNVSEMIELVKTSRSVKRTINHAPSEVIDCQNMLELAKALQF